MEPVPSVEDFEQFRESRLKRAAVRQPPAPTTCRELIDRMAELIRESVRRGERRIQTGLDFEPHLLTDLPFETPYFGLLNLADKIRWRAKLRSYLNELIDECGSINFAAFDNSSWVGLGDVPSFGTTWTLSCDMRLIVPEGYEVESPWR